MIVANIMPLASDRSHVTERETAERIRRYADQLKHEVDPQSQEVIGTIPLAPESRDVEGPSLLLPVNPPGKLELSFLALQEWEGRVEHVDDSTFTAILIDKTADEKIETERAVFSVEDVSANDKRLLREGAIFRWVIGYQRLRGGMRQRVSQLVFRRLPVWGKRDLELARQKSRELLVRLRASSG